MSNESKTFFPNYAIRRDGSVVNTKTGRVLKNNMSPKGYPFVTVCKDCKTKSFLIHRLLAIAFIPNPDNKKVVNHINSIRHDNRIENLEWCTQRENILHGYKYGYIKPPKGELQGSSKLKDDDVLLIRKSTKTQTELATIFNVNQTTISNIITGKSWNHL